LNVIFQVATALYEMVLQVSKETEEIRFVDEIADFLYPLLVFEFDSERSLYE